MQNVDIENKVQALKFIYYLCKPLYSELEITFPAVVEHNLQLDAAICNVAYNLHQAQRQSFNNSSGKAKTKFNENAGVTISVHGTTKTFSVESLKRFYVAAMAEANYTQDNYPSWGGTVQTLLTILTCFGERLKETRIIPVGITVNKRTTGDSTETQVMDFKRMGVKVGHRQFCSGANFKPFVKSGLAQSLGPLTQVCMLSLAADDRYADKWVAAVNRCFAYVPSIEQVSRVLKTNRVGANQPIVSHLANIAMIAGGREQRRMTPPLSAVMHYLTTKTGETWGFNAAAARQLDFSGKGAFYFYKLMCQSPVTYTLNINNEDMSRQILFHAMFGTYVEDLGILQFMTGFQHWLTRSEMSGAFTTMKASAPGMGSGKKFKPIPILYYSKLASATLLKDAATTTQATNANPIMAGYRIRKFTNEMAEALKAEEGQIASIQTVSAACTHLAAVTNHLIKVTDSRDYEAGTVSWRKMEDLTAARDGTAVDLVPRETATIFWSS